MSTAKTPKMSVTATMGGRERRKLQHQALSRLQLLDAAETVFGQKGFHETTLKEIAELAEFSVGSVYSFFESKDDLFRQIFVRRGDEFMPLIRELLASKRTPLEQLHDLVDFEVGYFRAHPRFGRLFLTFSSASLQSSDRLADDVMMGNFEETMTLQAEMFRRGQSAEQLIAGDPWVLARLLSGLMASYQALDPLVMSDEPDQVERLSLVDFHRIVDRTFARWAPRSPPARGDAPSPRRSSRRRQCRPPRVRPGAPRCRSAGSRRCSARSRRSCLARSVRSTSARPEVVRIQRAAQAGSCRGC